MARPTDHIAGEGRPTDFPGGGEPVLRKVPMIDPGFREEPAQSVLRPRILGMKKPSDPNDRRNLQLLGAAIVLAALIFAVLEYRQFREVAREAKHSAMEFMGTK